MSDFLQGLVRQRQMQETQAQRLGMVRQRMLAEQAEQARLEAWRQQQLQQQGALRQQALQQQAGIAAGNLDIQNRRLNLTERRIRSEQYARDQQRGLAERKAQAEAEERQRKLQGVHAQDLSNLEAINSSVQDFVGRMGSIQRPSNRWGFSQNFGMFPEVATRYLPGQPYDTLKELEQLEDMAKTSGLGNVRAQSGQSIGAITEREWPILSGQLLKLGVGMTEGAAEDMMSTARKRLLNMRNRELMEYQNKWKSTPFYKSQPFSVPPVESQGNLAGIPKTFTHGPEIWDNLTDEEKALWLPGMGKKK